MISDKKTTTAPLPDHIHFVGIGGAGMSGLAAMSLDLGVRVSGSDTAESAATRRLRIRGAAIAFGHAAEHVPPDTDLLVFSSAVPAENPERHVAEARGVRTVRRGEFLAELAQLFPTVIAIAGSHGKTTTTAMVAHIFRETHRKPGFLIGGEVPGWNGPASVGDRRILITEVDESDGTQALISSTIAAVLNIDDDHCWSVGGQDALENCFAAFAGNAGGVVAWASDETRRVLRSVESAAFIDERSIPDSLQLAIPGAHNLINAAMAIELATRGGIDREAAIQALKTFPGVGRRMTVHHSSPDTRRIIIEDYAHHPTELRMTLEGLRAAYPGHRLHVIFQPHRFERVKRFGKQFSQLLSTADAVTIYDTFAAWVADPDSASARQIAADILNAPTRFQEGDPEALADALTESARTEKTVFAVIGAGNVRDVIAPLKAALITEELTRMAAFLRDTVSDCEIRTDTAWSACTTLGIGKACPLLAFPETETALRTLLRTARERRWPVRLLGHGSNLVGSDTPMIDVVICLRQGVFAESAVAGDTLVAGAGTSLPKLLKMAGEQGLLDPAHAPLAWIPGTVGGAVRVNAGAGQTDMSRIVSKISGFFTDGAPFERSADDITWTYRGSDLPGNAIISQVCFMTGRGDATAFQTAFREHGDWRKHTQPGGRSAGCVFRNAGTVSAGKLIDQCGFKGHLTGGCRVANRHANFIVSTPGATEQDFLELAATIRAGVYQKTSVNLNLEAEFVNPDTAKQFSASVAPLTITVLKGGPSEERNISLISGAAVADALREAGLIVHEVDVQTAELPRIPRDTDVVFPVLHGTFGEDGQLQKLLENAGWPFVGSGSEASRVAMVKSETKAMLKQRHIPTAQWLRVTSPDTPAPADFPFPVIVKPDAQGSSVGMTKLDCPDPGAWRRALSEALAVDTAALVERFIPGIEITVGILQGTPLPVCEIIPPAGRVFDYDAKYDHIHGHTEYLCPPKSVSAKAQRLATEYALAFYQAIGAKDLLRVDFIVDGSDIPHCLEGNSIPGFTPSSLLPKAAAEAGITFVELCARLVKGALPGAMAR
ncbi:MAG: D-alanine--D-alanine ligase [Lentisphaeria bacterium]|nr:D-alanine--D-alanine ligase [Lentisphaeria bacterium]